MYEKLYIGHLPYPQNIIPIFVSKLALRGINNTDIPPERIVRVVERFKPTMNETRVKIFDCLAKGPISLKEIGEEVGITSERVRQLINLSINEMTKGINIYFIAYSSDDARTAVDKSIEEYRKSPIEECQRLFLKSHIQWLKAQGITINESLYQNVDKLINTAPTQTLKLNLQKYKSGYESRLRECAFWEDFS